MRSHTLKVTTGSLIGAFLLCGGISSQTPETPPLQGKSTLVYIGSTAAKSPGIYLYLDSPRPPSIQARAAPS